MIELLSSPAAIPLMLYHAVIWYFVRKPLKIIQWYWRYAVVFAEIISFTFLLRTLLSPWKGIVGTYPKYGLQIAKIFEAFTLNCFSRIIGMILRTAVLLFGFAVESIVLIIGFSFLIFWMSYPFIFLWAIGYPYFFLIL